MTNALFINGIYDTVLQEIVAAQEERGGGDSFIQPYKGVVITMLRDRPPTPDAQVRLYISTTANLSQICYTAEIVGWEDKREMTQVRRKVINRHLSRYQPRETNLFEGVEEVGETAVNLVTIRNLLPLDTLYSTSLLTKCSDDLPLKKRTRSGGWSEVYDIGDLISLPSQIQDRVAVELSAEVAKAALLPASELKRLASQAPKLPERIQIVSLGFRRSAHVIVAVLRRANGICEQCGRTAPFTRRSDGSPFLEVHHRTPLSQGGEDTIANAVALCPNCHREAHHG